MSGPKIDRAELERRKQVELERQRQERLRRIKEETDKLNRVISKSSKEIDTVSNHLVSEIKMIGNSTEMVSIINSLKDIKASYIKQLENLLSQKVPTEPEEITKYTQTISNTTISVVQSYFRDTQPFESRVKEYIKHNEITEQLETIKFIFEKETIKGIEDFDFSLFSGATGNAMLPLPAIKDRTITILKEIEELINSDSIQVSDSKILYKIAGNIYQSAFGEESGYQAALNEYKILKPNIVKNIEIFDELYLEYYARYILYLEILNKTSQKAVLPKEKHRFVSIEHLQNEIDLLTQQSKIENEKSYIREQIDQTMKEFGYNITKEIVFDDKYKGNHFISINLTNSTAIHVHLADNKQIMMEIVAVDTELAPSMTYKQGGDFRSAPPMKYEWGGGGGGLLFGHTIRETDLNENDKNYLVSQMGSFCELHPKIIEALNKKGVVFNKKTRKEPNKRYCKKIYLSNSKEKIDVKKDNLINEFDYFQSKKSAKKPTQAALNG